VIVAPANCRADLYVEQIINSRILPVPPGGVNVVHPVDVAEGIIAALTYGVEGHKYILSGWNVSYWDLFKQIKQRKKLKTILFRIPGAARVPLEFISHFSKDNFLTPPVVRKAFGYKYYLRVKALVDLGWTPRYSLDDIISTSWPNNL
jgi:nucleoside-diphosphate-sugar epimerase